ncbi:hypothetical protein KAR91_25345 [Candidatus Pacearchaeota archaeon]|nr:hypothetical protein [Candidatus Pacearchaeota archaeon]
MTAETRADLKSNMDTEIADNTTGDISAQDVRDNMKDAADSAVFPEDIPSLLGAGLTGIIDPINDIIPSVNGGDPALFDVSGGDVIFSDSYTDPATPTETRFSFIAVTAQTVTNIATDSATFLYISKATGLIVQESELQSFDYLRDHVGVGILQHADNVTITNVSGFTPSTIANALMALADYSSCVGAVNCISGGQNVVSGNSGTLSLDKAQGCWYYFGINVRTSLKSPSVIDSAALVAPTLLIGWRVTDNPEGKLIAQTTVPAGVYDDDTAVLADALPQGTVANNDWVNHRVFHVTDSDQLVVQIGQQTYGSDSAAIAGLPTEVFEILPVLGGTTPIATLTMRGAATDLSISGDASIRQAIPPRATFQ